VEANAAALVVSALDEVCWLFNLRGQDIPYNPVFMSYALITKDVVNL
jgi:Xaa-Pro aminopeptidase